MGHDATKPVFGVSDKVRFKSACSAPETSKKIEISLIARLDLILSNTRITKALIRLRGCQGYTRITKGTDQTAWMPRLYENNKGTDQTVRKCRLVCALVVRQP